MQDAKGCFMIAARNYLDRAAAVSRAFRLSQIIKIIVYIVMSVIHKFIKIT